MSAACAMAFLCGSLPGRADEQVEATEMNPGNSLGMETDPAIQETVPKPAEDPSATPTPGNTPPDAAKEGEKSAPDVSVVKRPTAEKYVPQPIQEEIRKNPDGKVSFSVKGQPWEPVLQWLADASALSLDWQELPADSLNLITSRDYTMEEARDLINRHLISRGFTMIVNGEIMTIVKLKELNPALVQRVKPDQLKMLPDHTICKVSFDLDWLIADEAVEELKPMLSSAGQIHKLSRTNRLEVVDTAVSLRQIWELIESEQSTDGEEQLVRAFRLKHRRAEDVIRMLRELLNIKDPSGGSQNSGQMDPNMAAQMMEQVQQQMQAMQQAAAQATGAAGGAAKKAIETRLVLNPRENMILAQAAPDQMAVIEKAVEQIDVEKDVQGTLIDNINRMKMYRLESVDPQTVAELLQQLGDLSPSTVLKVDKQKRTIIAWASLADHLTITTLVDRMDQSSRKVEVVQLRRLDAEYVAGTIRLLMGKEEPKEDNSFNRWRFFDMGMMNSQTPSEPSFKVEADTENNRLLVNANAVEMDEIRDLLMKLGELQDPNGTQDRIRVLDLNADEDLEQLQKQLERYWQRSNRLKFNLPKPTPKPVHDDEKEAVESKSTEHGNIRADDVTGDSTDNDSSIVSLKARDRGVRVWPKRSNAGQRSGGTASADDRFDQLLEATDRMPSEPEAIPVRASLQDEQSTTSEPRISRELLEKLRRQIQSSPEMPESGDESIQGVSADRGGSDHPERASDLDDVASESTRQIDRHRSSRPVEISMTPDGKLLISSDDPEALIEMEELISQIAAPKRSFKVFKLKYATPSWVTLNLRDFFKAEEETKSTLEYSPYWGIIPSQKKVGGSKTLSRRRQPQFISDNFTSTILVRDADAKQLQTIEDLIALYDVPEPSDSRSVRVTTVFRLRNAKASIVAAAVKDVFRDLLSSNDKALEKDDKNQQRQSSSGLVTFLPGTEKKEGDDEEEPIRFKGLLSMGIDDSSNTLIVSSTGALMDTVGELIEELDTAADSSSVIQVIKVDKSVDIGLIKQRLDELMESGKSKASLNQTGQIQPVIPGMPTPGQTPAEGGEATPSSE